MSSYFYGHLKSDVLASRMCGCYFCFRVFAKEEVRDYGLDRYDQETYAICPYCDIDAVVGDVIGTHVLTTEWQQERHATSFGFGGASSDEAEDSGCEV